MNADTLNAVIKHNFGENFGLTQSPVDHREFTISTIVFSKIFLTDEGLSSESRHIYVAAKIDESMMQLADMLDELSARIRKGPIK